MQKPPPRFDRVALRELSRVRLAEEQFRQIIERHWLTRDRVEELIATAFRPSRSLSRPMHSQR